jgi:hypothetical protein
MESVAKKSIENCQLRRFCIAGAVRTKKMNLMKHALCENQCANAENSALRCEERLFRFVRGGCLHLMCLDSFDVYHFCDPQSMSYYHGFSENMLYVIMVSRSVLKGGGKLVWTQIHTCKDKIIDSWVFCPKMNNFCI